MRLIVATLFALALAGCGFHPRPELLVPESLGPLTVQTADPYSSLGLELAAALERAGAAQAAPDAPAATLRITAEAWDTAPLSVDELARVREYLTRYRVQFSLLDAAGKVLVEPQEIELSREYTYDISASAGSPAEQELIQRELRRDMRRAILRRIDVVLRPRS